MKIHLEVHMGPSYTRLSNNYYLWKLLCWILPLQDVMVSFSYFSSVCSKVCQECLRYVTMLKVQLAVDLIELVIMKEVL